MWLLIDRGPSIARVNGENAAERPSAHDSFYPAMVSVEDNRLPHTKSFERFVDIKIRSPVRELRIVKIRVSAVRARACIHAVRPRKLRLSREGMRELMLD